MTTFAFATGSENSAPTIRGGRKRMDQLEACGFCRHWATDFDLPPAAPSIIVRALGVDS